MVTIESLELIQGRKSSFHEVHLVFFSAGRINVAANLGLFPINFVNLIFALHRTNVAAALGLIPINFVERNICSTGTYVTAGLGLFPINFVKSSIGSYCSRFWSISYQFCKK